MKIFKGIKRLPKLPKVMRPPVNRAIKLAPEIAFKALTILSLPITLPTFIALKYSLEKLEPPEDDQDPVI